MRGRARAADAALGLLLALVLLGGLWRPGYPLLRDMVATPHPPLGDAALGLGGAAARAVPQDLVTVAGTRLLAALGLPEGVLLALLCTVFCVWAALGAGALVRRVWPGAGLAHRAPAVLTALWNPWVVERMLQGHWSLLAGLAAVLTIPALLAGPAGPSRRRVAGAAACLLAAGLTPTGWLLALVATVATALGCALRGSRPRPALVGGLAAATALGALPWLAATALGGVAGGGSTGVEAFAARAEPMVGTLGATLALGGIWNGQAVPDSRTGWWVPVALAAWLAVAALGARELWRRRRQPAVTALVPLGVATWLLVALAATPPGLAALDALVRADPGAGLLRDTQKLLALAVPAWVLAAAAATRAVAGARAVPPLLAAGLTGLLVVASVPDAPAVLWRELRPSAYGPGWSEVRRLTAERPDTVLVLPGGSIRSTPLWAAGRPVLDPAPRMLDAPVAVPGDLRVAGTAAGGVRGEDARARETVELLVAGADPAELRRRGVRWVLDERTSAGPRGEYARTLAGARVAYADEELVLHELVGEVIPSPGASEGRRRAVLAAHLLWALGLAAAVSLTLAPGSRPGRRAPRRGRRAAPDR